METGDHDSVKKLQKRARKLQDELSGILSKYPKLDLQSEAEQQRDSESTKTLVEGHKEAGSGSDGALSSGSEDPLSEPEYDFDGDDEDSEIEIVGKNTMLCPQLRLECACALQ